MDGDRPAGPDRVAYGAAVRRWVLGWRRLLRRRRGGAALISVALLPYGQLGNRGRNRILPWVTRPRDPPGDFRASGQSHVAGALFRRAQCACE